MVPVRVEDWPEQNSAMPKSFAAITVPSRGASKRYACWISVTSWCARKNVAAARIRMAPLMNIAPFKATTQSTTFQRTAVRFSATLRPMRRVCTSAECR